MVRSPFFGGVLKYFLNTSLPEHVSVTPILHDSSQVANLNVLDEANIRS